MSRRPIAEKQSRKRSRSLRIGLPGYIDLYQWLKDRHRLTSGTCEALIKSGAIRAESHPLRTRFIPAHLRDQLMIVDPETGAPINAT